MPDTQYSFVVGSEPHFGYQAYLLAKSLIELAQVPASRISAHLVDGTDSSVREALDGLGIRTRQVSPFGHPYCNRLQQLACLLEDDAEQFVLLDTDMFAMRPLSLPPKTALFGKPVDAPNPRYDVLDAIFSQAGLRLNEAETDVIPGKTAAGNFNGGLHVVPKEHLPILAEAWIRWARWSLDRIDLYGEWRNHVDQVSLALAVAETALPVRSLPRHYNFPTHLGPITAAEPPFLLHYHRHVDDQLFLKPTGGPADRSIAEANEVIRRWRRTDLCNSLFWGARYSLNAQLGSGIGSRGDTLDLKRDVVRRVVSLLRPQSVVDVGGGDGAVLEGLANGVAHHVTDVSQGAEAPYLKRNPEAQFARSDITQEVAVTADLAICLDVLLHIADPAHLERAVRNMVASGRIASLISGYDERPTQTSSLTHFHAPLLELIESDPHAVAYPLVAYRELTGYLVQRGEGTGHARDAAPQTLRRAMPLVEDPFGLLECVTVSRRELGFFPDHLSRCIEYPWVLKRVRMFGEKGLKIVDVGAGVNVLPLLLADDGHSVTTVDAHRQDRTSADRSTWNEWGYLDYSTLRPTVVSVHEDYATYQTGGPADVIYSVSVIEHIPAEARRKWISRMTTQLRVGGTLLLTVDLQPKTRLLWRRSEGIDVETADAHGDLETLLAELREREFAIEAVDVHEWLPLSRVGVAMIAAKYRPVGSSDRGTVKQAATGEETLRRVSVRAAPRVRSSLADRPSIGCRLRPWTRRTPAWTWIHRISPHGNRSGPCCS